MYLDKISKISLKFISSPLEFIGSFENQVVYDYVKENRLLPSLENYELTITMKKLEPLYFISRAKCSDSYSLDSEYRLFSTLILAACSLAVVWRLTFLHTEFLLYRNNTTYVIVE